MDGYIPSKIVNSTKTSNMKNSLLFKSGMYSNQYLKKKEPAKKILLNMNIV